MGQLLRGGQGPQESQRDPNPEGEQSQHPSSLRAHGHTHTLLLTLGRGSPAPLFPASSLTSLRTLPQETTLPQPPSQPSPHPWAPMSYSADAHIPQYSRVSHSQSSPFSPQTHRVPLGAVIACRAFGPWWSSLPCLPRLSFLTTLSTWTLQSEWRGLDVKELVPTLQAASATPQSLNDKGTVRVRPRGSPGPSSLGGNGGLAPSARRDPRTRQRRTMGLESKASELSLTLTPGSPWTPGDPDSPGSPYKQMSVRVSS